MTWTIPNYVPVDYIRPTPLTYEWDFYDPYAVLGARDSHTLECLAKLSDRAMIAYAIGCAEWVVCRLIDHLPDRQAFDYLEACWAFEMSDEVALPKETKESEWGGIVLAPVDLALVTIINTVYDTEDKQGEVEASFAELIPLHVLVDTSWFLTWRREVLDRLGRYYRRVEDDVWGRPVPREALDPSIGLERMDQTHLIETFLGQIENNPYVEYVQPPSAG